MQAENGTNVGRYIRVSNHIDHVLIRVQCAACHAGIHHVIAFFHSPLQPLPLFLRKMELLPSLGLQSPQRSRRAHDALIRVVQRAEKKMPNLICPGQSRQVFLVRPPGGAHMPCANGKI
jgi:hypothetical protein